MQKKLLWLLSLLGVVLSFSAQADSLSTPLKKLDEYVQEHIQEEDAVGCAVAVVSQGKVVFMKAYGVRKKGEKAPVDLNTVFQLGSVSKPITASLIALLQKQKLLSVKTAVTTYYPHVLPTTTLQHILSHTSGYSRTGWNNKIEAGQSRAQLLTALAKSKQKMPGETFDYHNLAYTLSEEVVAKTCKQSFQEALTERFFRPLNMTQTSVGYPAFEKLSNRAWPHEGNKKGRWEPSKTCSHFYNENVCAAAGINSTIKDMATFLQLQLGGHPEILTRQELAPFHAPVISAPDAVSRFEPLKVKSYYGQGWRIVDYDKGRLVFHGGWIKGIGHFLAFLPDHDIGIVVLHNGEGKFAFKTALMFFDECLK